MTVTREVTKITIRDNGERLRERLAPRLARMTELRCSDHDQPVVALAIHGRENGWFDATMTTCCDPFEKQAFAIVRDRC